VNGVKWSWMDAQQVQSRSLNMHRSFIHLPTESICTAYMILWQGGYMHTTIGRQVDMMPEMYYNRIDA